MKDRPSRGRVAVPPPQKRNVRPPDQEPRPEQPETETTPPLAISEELTSESTRGCANPNEDDPNQNKPPSETVEEKSEPAARPPRKRQLRRHITTTASFQQEANRNFNALDLFYKNSKRFAYSFQGYVFMTRVQAIEKVRDKKRRTSVPTPHGPCGPMQSPTDLCYQ